MVNMNSKGESSFFSPTTFFKGDEGLSDVISCFSATRTIVITSGKGGVGKTTATANLGMSIARLGYRVALIDADIGLRNLDLVLGLENRILFTAVDILDGHCRLDQALIRDKRSKNLSLLSISKSRQRYNVTRKNMQNMVESIAALGYHFILLDCPAGIDVGFITAISSAKEAVVITTPEITAIRDADRVAGLLEANHVYDVKLLINRVRAGMIQRNTMMSIEDVQEMLAIPLLGAIPEDKHVVISTNRGEPLVSKTTLTLSAIAFDNAARRLIGRQDYVFDLPSSSQNGALHNMMEGSRTTLQGKQTLSRQPLEGSTPWVFDPPVKHAFSDALFFDEERFTLTYWIRGTRWWATLFYIGVLALGGSNWLLPRPFHVNRNFNMITASAIIIHKPLALWRRIELFQPHRIGLVNFILEAYKRVHHEALVKIVLRARSLASIQIARAIPKNALAPNMASMGIPFFLSPRNINIRGINVGGMDGQAVVPPPTKP